MVLHDFKDSPVQKIKKTFFMNFIFIFFLPLAFFFSLFSSTNLLVKSMISIFNGEIFIGENTRNDGDAGAKNEKKITLNDTSTHFNRYI
jgi:hypothetical protein